MVLRGSVSTYISEKYGSEKSMRIKDVFLKLFTFPPFIAIIAGILVLIFQIPIPTSLFLIIKSPINTISSAIGSILIGIIIAYMIKEELKTYWPDIKNVLIWRLGISFIFFMPVVYFLQFDPLYQTEIRTILLIIVLGPSAVFSVIFSIYFNLEEKFAAITVATVTLICLAILPILIIFGLNLF
jgi:predicted permease